MTKLSKGDKNSLLQAKWRYPTLSIHGIEGAFAGSGAKTVIPRKVNQCLAGAECRRGPSLLPPDPDSSSRLQISGHWQVLAASCPGPGPSGKPIKELYAQALEGDDNTSPFCQDIAKKVIAHVESEFAKLNSPNKMKIELEHAGRPWMR